MNGRRLAISLGACLVAGPAPADGPADDKARAAEFLVLARAEAAAYTIEDAAGARLALRPEPVLAWSNPVVGSIQGDVFVWTAKGRPEVVGSLHKWYSPHTHRSNEFVSLAGGPLVAARDGARVWAPSRAGVEFRPIPDAPAPDPSPERRLRQLRALAAGFAARETDREGVDRDLRLLSQPIYRYEKAEGGPFDGALFAFALGTDPEALLVIEARAVDGAPRWHYALARMNSIAMRATYKNREVWSLPTIPFAATHVLDEPYTSFLFDFKFQEATRP